MPENYTVSVKRASSYNVAGSFLAVLTGAHLVHLLGGLIALLNTAINIKRNKYTKENHLGFDLTGYEIDRKYFEAAKKRIEQHKAQKRLF